ncbi:hypothetical protein JQ038_07595 [Clostridium botulinum]|nr:hypothetical protein [Clostridium botulinum]MCS4470037.1 hypothetical protein [Clostridium botulinum]MCS4473546.1 hypothetical protein [Clostridium botulinum]MCS4476221.1 hypothetical protein [Clostridium botulinum]MCS4479423.1 hypothetical protein [Clostridium botulinum]
MKKFLSILIIGTLSLGLFGCANGKVEEKKKIHPVRKNLKKILI